MATPDGVRAAFALLAGAGYRMPKDAVPSELHTSWLRVMDGVSDRSLLAEVRRYTESEGTFWPVPGPIRTKITGGYQPAPYWRDRGGDGPPVSPEDVEREWAKYFDLDELKRRDALRRARTNPGESHV